MAALRFVRRCRSESGAELIEFGLTFPLLLLVVLGIMDFGLLFRDYEVITNAAREGARVAVLPNYSSADATTRVNQYLTAAGLDPTLWNSSVGAPVSSPLPDGNCEYLIEVDVTYPHGFTFLTGIGTYFGASFGTVTLTAHSTMRTETPAGTCS
jgi:Flp pilus assembly protein TadG